MHSYPLEGAIALKKLIKAANNYVRIDGIEKKKSAYFFISHIGCVYHWIRCYCRLLHAY